jgi:anti-anti-sigma factor
MPKPLAYSRLSTSRPRRRRARADRYSRVHDALAAGQLTICSERQGSTHVIAVVGELDLATAQRLEDELRTVEATDVEQVIVDLAGLTFIDSSGVHLIAAAEERCRTTAKRLVLRPGPPQIQRVFALAGADTLPLAA